MEEHRRKSAEDVCCKAINLLWFHHICHRSCLEDFDFMILSFQTVHPQDILSVSVMSACENFHFIYIVLLQHQRLSCFYQFFIPEPLRFVPMTILKPFSKLALDEISVIQFPVVNLILNNKCPKYSPNQKIYDITKKE